MDLHPDNQLAPAECFFVRLKSLGPAWECFKREPRSPVVVLDRDQIQRIGQPTDVARVLPGLTLVERRLLWREPDSCSVDVVSLLLLGDDRRVDVAVDELLGVTIWGWRFLRPPLPNGKMIGEVAEQLVERDPLVLLADPFDSVVHSRP